MSSTTDIQKLITEHQRRLQKLKEKQARFGVNTPPEILTEIEDIRAEIGALQSDLETEQAQLQQTLNNLPNLNLPGAADFQQQIKERLTDIETHLSALNKTAALFDQRGQQVGVQYNVAGDLIQQAASTPAANPADLRRAYLNRLMLQTRRLPLSGVDPKTAGDEQSRDLQLGAVYTALLTQRPELDYDAQTRSLNFSSGEPGRQTRRLSALEALNKEPRLALLGEPGSGKSTFVNFVGLCLAGEGLGDTQNNLQTLTAPLPVEDKDKEKKKPQPQPWDHGPLLPARVVLRDLAARGLPQAGQAANGDTLWKFIVAELGETLKEFAPYLKKEWQEQGGLILLDGLDEVPDANQRRVQVKQAVQGFAADFPHCRFLVTSRTYAYQRQDWKLEGFAEAVLSPFTSQQINRFVEQWYAHIAAVRGMNPDDAQGRATLLKTVINRSPRLSELAARPLLLTLMASLHAWRGGSLPDKREELYADAVDLLLERWESPKVVRNAAGQPSLRQPSLAEWLKVDRSVVRTELNRLAFEAHRDQPKLVGTADISQAKLVDALLKVSDNPAVNPRQLVVYLRDRAGLLAARGEGVYTFPHRTFQEYLAACHLTDHDFPEEIAELLKSDPQRWREATLLAGAKAAGGAASSAWNLAEALCYTQAPLSGETAVAQTDCWGALLAAQTLLENEGERLKNVSERNRPKLEHIRSWQRLIVERGCLPPVDRALAGKSLSVLGDDRDLEELVLIPAGPFLMGDYSDSDAAPQHIITLPAYRIGKYPVTNAQYARFVKATGRRWRDADFPPEKANAPARYVSWHNARAYCDWLTGIWRAEGRIAPDEEVRLPTEAEWEKAASWDRETRRGGEGERQGDKGIRGRKRRYPWGDEWDETRCNTAELGLGEPCVVGMFPQGASPYGCLDMAGNVFEWTLSLWGKDWHALEFKYPYDPTDGRENPEAGNKWLRVVRGGSFVSDGGSYARCAFRFRIDPGYGWFNVGFRIVSSPPSFSPSAL